ncbi:MAG: CDGSH iron-sulfur domain-containing protein [Xanthobacteraceae bacterium]
MELPTIAQKSPYLVEVEAGKTYYWCACGQSKGQPFCDGSHKTTPFTPLPYTAASAGRAAFCGCKQTKGKPMCDGSHKAL